MTASGPEEPGARPVAPADRIRQRDRGARLAGAHRRGRPGPGRHQRVLALEEPVAAHAAGGPALGRVLVHRGDLHAARRRPRQGARVARHGDHHGGGVGPRRPGGRPRGRVSVHGAEPHHRSPRRQPDPGHAAGRPALRPDRRRGEPQQLRVRVMNTSSADSLSSWTAPTTASPSFSVISSNSSLACG